MLKVAAEGVIVLTSSSCNRLTFSTSLCALLSIDLGDFKNAGGGWVVIILLLPLYMLKRVVRNFEDGRAVPMKRPGGLVSDLYAKTPLSTKASVRLLCRTLTSKLFLIKEVQLASNNIECDGPRPTTLFPPHLDHLVRPFLELGILAHILDVS